jgi:hypothetical protein
VAIGACEIGSDNLTAARAMKIRYFEGTWAASCLASTAGAFYAGIVATLVSPRPISTFEFMGVVTISVSIALPVLAVGSLAFGWRISEFIVSPRGGP